MKKIILAVGVFGLALLSVSSLSFAKLNVNVNINPPPVVFSGEPELVVIPNTYVYFVPGYADVFFYDGYWYRDYNGRWFRAVDYTGPWVFIARPSVPYPFFHLPPNYRARVAYYPHVPYRQLRSNWRAWHRDRYWQRYGWNRAQFEKRREPSANPGRVRTQREQGVAPQVRNPGRERTQREHGVAPQFSGNRGSAKRGLAAGQGQARTGNRGDRRGARNEKTPAKP